MSLSQALLTSAGYEPNLLYLPNTGFKLAKTEWTDEKRTMWVKISGISQAVDVPVSKLGDKTSIGAELSHLYQWAEAQQASTSASDPAQPSAGGIQSSLSCEVDWSTPQATTPCEACNGKGSKKHRRCPWCNGKDPRCTTCKGKGAHVSDCYQCNGSGVAPSVYFFEFIDVTTSERQQIAFQPNLLDGRELVPGLHETSLLGPDVLVRKVDAGSWDDQSSVFASLYCRAPWKRGKEKVDEPATVRTNEWEQRLNRIWGLSSADSPHVVETMLMRDQWDSLGIITDCCDKLNIGFHLKNGEGVMGTGESGWIAFAMTQKKVSYLASWYLLPLCLHNAAELYLEFRERVA